MPVSLILKGPYPARKAFVFFNLIEETDCVKKSSVGGN